VSPFDDDDDPPENDPSQWTEIRIEDFIGLPGDGRPIPFRMFVKRFKSSSSDAELFVHDPLRQMLENPGALADIDDWPSPPEGRSEMQAIRDDPRFHVQTVVANHHRTLSKIHSYPTVLVGGDGIHVMVYKDAPSAADEASGA
jgi:hypothetical protein